MTITNDFIRAILDDGEPLINGESARSALEFVNAILLSAIRKKFVELPIDRDEYDALHAELSTGTAAIDRRR